MAAETKVKVAGVWKALTSVEIKVAGVWKTVTTVESKVGGAWKEVHSSGKAPEDIIVTVGHWSVKGIHHDGYNQGAIPNSAITGDIEGRAVRSAYHNVLSDAFIFAIWADNENLGADYFDHLIVDDPVAQQLDAADATYTFLIDDLGWANWFWPTPGPVDWVAEGSANDDRDLVVHYS